MLINKNPFLYQEKERKEKEEQRLQQNMKEKAEIDRLINQHNQNVKKNNMNTTQTLSNTSVDNNNR